MTTEGKKSGAPFKGGTFEEILDHVVFNNGSSIKGVTSPTTERTIPEEDERFYFLAVYREFKTCYDLFDIWTKK